MKASAISSSVNEADRKSLDRLNAGTGEVAEATLDSKIFGLLDTSFTALGKPALTAEERRAVREAYASLKAQIKLGAEIELQCMGQASDGNPCNEGTADRFMVDRFCVKCGLAHQWPRGEHSKYVTMLPNWAEPLKPELLPPLSTWSGDGLDIFARLGRPVEGVGGVTAIDPKASKEYVRRFVPYGKDRLAQWGFRCGSPLVYESGRIEIKTGLQSVFVLDLGWYEWSRTLKDPRSWAVTNIALDRSAPKRHLAVWTAGNAGLSLAMMVQAANLHLKPEEQISVYALFNSHEQEGRLGFAERVLRHWGCKTETVPNPHEDVKTPGQIRAMVQDIAGASFSEEQYWDVSDGWEGVGMLMYRLLFAQVIHGLKPDVIVIPVGTGNVLLGAALAIGDCNRRSSTCLVAVGPVHDNILDKLPRASRPKSLRDTKADSTPRAIMPKLASGYSPLLPCIGAMKDWFLDLRVTGQEQVDIARKLLDRSEHPTTLSEPSALAALAAIPHLPYELRNGRVLVVNTGYGLMRDDERAFWGSL